MEHKLIGACELVAAQRKVYQHSSLASLFLLLQCIRNYALIIIDQNQSAVQRWKTETKSEQTKINLTHPSPFSLLVYWIFKKTEDARRRCIFCGSELLAGYIYMRALLNYSNVLNCTTENFRMDSLHTKDSFSRLISYVETIFRISLRKVEAFANRNVALIYFAIN